MAAHHRSRCGCRELLPKCDPRPVTMLPLDEGIAFDIDELNDIGNLSPAKQGQAIATGKPPVSGSNAATGPGPMLPDPCAIQFDTNRPNPATLQMDGSTVLTCYEELPKTAGEGEIAFKKGENTAYVFDGEEWQNLGKVARYIRPGKDDKCNRKGAIAATKAKMRTE